MGSRIQTQTKAASKPSPASAKAKLLQRQNSFAQHNQDNEPFECRGERGCLLLRAGIGPTRAVPSIIPPVVHEVLQSPGQPLDATICAFMEPRFGYNFGNVRVHTDAKAAESARTVNALAYTVGRDVVFSAGQYSPDTDEGRKLMAHELTHVLQQGPMSQPIIKKRLEMTDPSDDSESHADRFADQIISNKGGIFGKIAQTQVSLQRACGRSEIGTVADCIGQSGDVSGEIFHFRINCDTFSPASDESRLHAFAATIMPNDIIEIHGFASIDGPADFNENLSCARAHKAQSILIQEGLSPAQIRPLIMHGATEGNATERRSIVIHKQAAIKVTPPSSEEKKCGPDITMELANVFKNIQDKFNSSWSDYQRSSNCACIVGQLIPLCNPIMAWDIRELFLPNTCWLYGNSCQIRNRCGRPSLGPCASDEIENKDTSPCGNSVQVGNRCFLAGTVNYGTFGIMCKLCHDHAMRMLSKPWVLPYLNPLLFTETGMKSFIWAFKKATGDDPGPPRDWALATYRSGPTGISGNENRKDCKDRCPSECARKRPFDFVWEPEKSR